MNACRRRARESAALLLALAVGACANASPPASALPASGSPAYLFSYFRGTGDDGVHLATSADGITWTALNGGRAVITPAITGDGIGWQDWNSRAALMRDPSIIYGPDKEFHMVWTVAWTDHGIGVAHSPDLIHWSPQTRVPVMDHEADALNAWAPDLFYDDVKREYVIVWATSIPGRFPATDSVAQKTSRGRADHRLYYTTTKDFKTYSHAALLYDGGFCAIDGTITKRGGTYYLVMKDETFFPVQTRNIRIASSAHATGPYGPASPSFTSKDTEGPSVLQTPEWSYIYYDEYTRGRYGAVRTKDFKHFEPFTDSLHAPRMRHGSAFLAPMWVLKGLQALDTIAK